MLLLNALCNTGPKESLEKSVPIPANSTIIARSSAQLSTLPVPRIVHISHEHWAGDGRRVETVIDTSSYYSGSLDVVCRKVRIGNVGGSQFTSPLEVVDQRTAEGLADNTNGLIVSDLGLSSPPAYATNLSCLVLLRAGYSPCQRSGIRSRCANRREYAVSHLRNRVGSLGM